MPGTASSTRSAACSTSSPASGVANGVGQAVWSAYQSAATRCSCAAALGVLRRRAARAARRRTGGGSGTSAARRRAGRRRGSPARAPRASLLAVVAPGDRVAQRARQLVEDGGVEQEVRTSVGLAVEHLLDEVVEDEAVAAGERLDEAVRARSRAAQRQGRELQARRPTPRCAARARRRAAASRSSPITSLRNAAASAGGEAQVGGAHLEQLAAGPQPRQRKRRIGAGGDRDGDLRRQVVEQEGRPPRGPRRRVDDVVVVERQHGRPGQRVEVVDEAGQHVLRAGGPVALEQRRRVGAQARVGQPDGRDEVAEEPPQVGVAGVEREPGDPGGCRAESHWVSSVVLPKPAGAQQAPAGASPRGRRAAGPSAGTASRAGVAAAGRAACRAAQPCPSA